MPVKTNIYNQNAEVVGELKLSDKVFNVELNDDLIHQAVNTQLSNEKQILAHTKIRSEVRGGGKKPWRQKGTGRARAGSSRSPIWTGGGVTFGPRKERNFSKKINKKMKQKALMMALSDRSRNKNLVILDKFDFNDYNTKAFDGIVGKIESIFSDEKKESKKRSLLFVNNDKNEKVLASSKNLTGVKVISLENLNIVDLLKYRNLIILESAIKEINERYSK
jgi:large subunit ribosomal protein L4